MADCTITPLDNGPSIVRGAFRVMDVGGTELVATGAAIAICRCGASNNKPFCDGTHVKINFQSVVRAAQPLPV